MKRLVLLNGEKMLKNAKVVAHYLTNSLYVPSKISPEADICINRCPHPNKSCKGKCDFFKQEYQKLKVK